MPALNTSPFLTALRTCFDQPWASLTTTRQLYSPVRRKIFRLRLTKSVSGYRRRSRVFLQKPDRHNQVEQLILKEFFQAQTGCILTPISHRRPLRRTHLKDCRNCSLKNPGKEETPTENWDSVNTSSIGCLTWNCAMCSMNCCREQSSDQLHLPACWLTGCAVPDGKAKTG